ncbi:TPA: hypothetical protein ACLM89_001629, partial [Neisseria meningitidis]
HHYSDRRQQTAPGPITPGGSFSDIANLALLKIQKAAFGDMGREQVRRVDTGHGWLPRSC